MAQSESDTVAKNKDNLKKTRVVIHLSMIHLLSIAFLQLPPVLVYRPFLPILAVDFVVKMPVKVLESFSCTTALSFLFEPSRR